MQQFKSKKERLEIVSDILRQLKSMELISDQIPNMKLVMNILGDYVNIDENQIKSGLSGKVPLPEIHREIEYTLPIRKQTRPIFVIKNKFAGN
jgi:septum formation topological specificity factor MinE